MGAQNVLWLEGFGLGRTDLADYLVNRYIGSNPTTVLPAGGSSLDAGRWRGWAIRGAGTRLCPPNFDNPIAAGSVLLNLFVDTPASLPLQLIGIYEQGGIGGTLLAEVKVIAGASTGTHKLQVLSGLGTVLGATVDRPDGFWEHVDFGFDFALAPDGRARLHVDGREILSLTSVGTFPAITDWDALAIGVGAGLVGDIVCTEVMAAQSPLFVFEGLPVDEGTTLEWVGNVANAKSHELLNEEGASDYPTTYLETTTDLTDQEHDLRMAHPGGSIGSTIICAQLEAEGVTTFTAMAEPLLLKALIGGVLYDPDFQDGAVLTGLRASFRNYPPVGSAWTIGRLEQTQWALVSDAGAGPPPIPSEYLRVSRFTLRVAIEYDPQVTPLTGPSPTRTPLAPNWRNGLQVEVSFPSDVVETLAASESRRGLLLRPERHLQFTSSGMSKSQSWLRRSVWMRRAQEDGPFPYWPDQAVTSAASSVDGSNTLIPLASGEALMRRFFPGARAWVFLSDGTVHGLYTIAEVLWDGVIISGTPSAVPAGSLLVPSFDVELELSQSAQNITDALLEISVVAVEARGVSCLPSIAPEAVAPGRQLFESVPILPSEWIEWAGGVDARISSIGADLTQGRGRILTVVGTRPVLSWSLRLFGHPRETIYEIQQFLESLRGRLYPFWMLDPGASLTLEDIQSTHADISAEGVEAADVFFSVLAIQTPETLYLLRFDSAALVGDVLRLTFAELFTDYALVVVADVVRCAPAVLVRMDKDYFEETWTTDTLCLFSLDVRELYSETDSAPQELFP